MSLQHSADFEGLLRAFDAHGIRLVVIGGVSAALQGVPALTFDLDVMLAPYCCGTVFYRRLVEAREIGYTTRPFPWAFDENDRISRFSAG